MRLRRISLRSFLAIVQTGTEIGNNLISPTFGSAKRFEQFLQANQIALLIVARHAGQPIVGMSSLPRP